MAIANSMGELDTNASNNHPRGTESASLLDDGIRANSAILKRLATLKSTTYSGNTLTIGSEGGAYNCLPTGNITNLLGGFTDGVFTLVFSNTTEYEIQASSTITTSESIKVKAGRSVTVTKASNGVFTVIGFELTNRIIALEARGDNIYDNATAISGVCDLGSDSNQYKVIAGSGNITSFTGGVLGKIYHLVTDYDLTISGVNFPRGEASITMLRGDMVIIECHSSGYFVKAYTRQQYNNFSAAAATGLDLVYNGSANGAANNKSVAFPVNGNQLCMVKVRVATASTQLNGDESVWCYLTPFVTAGSLITALPYKVTLQGGHNCSHTEEFSFFARAGNGSAGVGIGSGGGTNGSKNLQVSISIEIVKLTD